MSFEVTDQWIVDTMLKNDWCLNTEVFVYPEGVDKKELPIPAHEKVVASITDVLYLSRIAVYVRDKAGKYTRLPWSDIDDIVWSLRKVNGQTVQAIGYKTTDGRKIVTPMPFTFVPAYFSEVHETCFAELTAGGKICKLPGPARFQAYARAPGKDAAWTQSVRRDRTVWFRELACPCAADQGFALRYLGRLLKNGLVADGKLRQRVVAECKGCANLLEVFDSFRNGYNAVICGEQKKEPPGREATTAYKCRCDKNEFSLGAAAVYDTDSEDLAGFRKDKRSEAYGWFTLYATCRSCKRVMRLVDYETA
ncbi:MAG TPA: hypothetical protein VH370_10160 [Humisphaera sp.]|nr:hypothetical protein [Humisphaera sp.]